MTAIRPSSAIVFAALAVAGESFARTGGSPESIYRDYDCRSESELASPTDGPSTACPGGSDGDGADCKAGCRESWTLQQRKNRRGIEYGGWASLGITVNNFGNTTRDGNAPLGFNSDPHLNLDQLWGFVAREAQKGGGLNWGFRLDYVFGVDGPDTQAFGDTGWDSRWDGGGGYGSAMPQLYLEAARNDLSLKIGHFFTIVGYEVIQAPENFFYSHTYLQYYAQPFTHTGFLADYSVDEQLSVSGGFVYGWDSGVNNVDDAAMFLGGATWTSQDANTSLAFAVTAGDWGDGVKLGSDAFGNDGDLYMQSLVFSHAFGNEWTYVLEWDYAKNFLDAAADTSWYGSSSYLLKKINCCWSVGARAAWFNDADGVRVGTGTAGAGDYYEVTLGANWNPHPNLRVRPEVRYDWFNGAGFPMDGGTRRKMLTFGIDAVFTF